MVGTQRSQMRGQRLCLGLHLRWRSEFAVTRWPLCPGPLHGWCCLTRELIWMHGSGIARRALGDARQTRRPVEAVRNAAEPDRLGAVLDMAVRELARTWSQQRPTRGPSFRSAAVL